jgi:hypothetical protein
VDENAFSVLQGGRPNTRLWLEMARKLKLYPCRICGTFVEVENGYRNFAKEHVLKAIANETGLVYWQEELAGCT